MEECDNAQLQLKNAFPEALRQHATATAIFGGEFDFEKMNFVQRAVIRKIANVDHSISKISDEKISEFVTAMQ